MEEDEEIYIHGKVMGREVQARYLPGTIFIILFISVFASL